MAGLALKIERHLLLSIQGRMLEGTLVIDIVHNQNGEKYVIRDIRQLLEGPRSKPLHVFSTTQLDDRA
jgi:hypothetical protein